MLACRRPPERLSLGYGVAALNLCGSVLFLVASCFYFAQVPPWDEPRKWEWYASEWGVRFPFLLGSIAFTVGAVLGMKEALSD